jgi:hypothetical protein
MPALWQWITMPSCGFDILHTENLQPKANMDRVLIAGLGAAAGYMLCGGILHMIDPFMDVSVARFFSALAGIVFAAIAWKVA